ncbi:helix-turn-helix domain-containing protein [Streptomyces mirabilis]|uniref:helix-turn-helix domain-containing protein n=1 Tax=Streptomyces mirabilis TaxID=68239 RepID=UPI0036DF150F
MPRAIKPSLATEPRRPLAKPQEIADYLGVPLGTVYQWSSRGGGPRMSRVGRHLRARWEDLDAYLDANRVNVA